MPKYQLNMLIKRPPRSKEPRHQHPRKWPTLPGRWWRHQMETFSALLPLCAGNSPVTGEFPSQRPVTRSFDFFFDLSLYKWLIKQSRRRWFETPLRSFWRHTNNNPGPVRYKSSTSGANSGRIKQNYVTLQRSNFYGTPFCISVWVALVKVS